MEVYMKQGRVFGRPWMPFNDKNIKCLLKHVMHYNNIYEKLKA